MISAEGKVLLYPPDNDPPKVCYCYTFSSLRLLLRSKKCSGDLSLTLSLLYSLPDNVLLELHFNTYLFLQEFTFDGAYFMDSTAEQIYNESVFPLVEVRSFISLLHLLHSHFSL